MNVLENKISLLERDLEIQKELVKKAQEDKDNEAAKNLGLS